MNLENVNKDAELVFNYLNLSQSNPDEADLILVFCSSDLRVAEFASKLYLDKLAPKIVFSGGATSYRNPLLAKSEFKTEAELFANRAIDLGVPKADLLLEDKSENTGENIAFSYNLISELKLRAKKIIITQKPYMMRRTLAALEKQWPDKSTEFIPISEDISYWDYTKKMNETEFNYFINTMVGDLQRVIEYSKPKYNFQSYQEVSPGVMASYLNLVDAGYNQRLL